MRPIIVASEPTPDMSGPRERLALEEGGVEDVHASAERRPRIHFEVPLSRPSRVLLVCAANCGSSDPAVARPQRRCGRRTSRLLVGGLVPLGAQLGDALERLAGDRVHLAQRAIELALRVPGLLGAPRRA